MQESVYTKLALNQTVSNNIVEKVIKNKPKSGLVQLLVITEKQFARMEVIVGQVRSTVLASDERVVIL